MLLEDGLEIDLVRVFRLFLSLLLEPWASSLSNVSFLIPQRKT